MKISKSIPTSIPKTFIVDAVQLGKKRHTYIGNKHQITFPVSIKQEADIALCKLSFDCDCLYKKPGADY